MAACIANGGNVWLEEPTVLEIDGNTSTYPAGCYFYQSCIDTFPSFAGDVQSWTCENQDELVIGLLAVAGTSLVVACVASGGCLLAGVASARGAVTVETSLGGATGAAVGLAVVQAAMQPATPTDISGVGFDPSPGLQSLRDPAVFGAGGHDSVGGGGGPIGPGQVCPPGSPREGETIPEFAPNQWSHIVDEHAPHLEGSPPNPDKSLFDQSFDDEQIGDLIRAAYCWGLQQENTGGAGRAHLRSTVRRLHDTATHPDRRQ